MKTQGITELVESYTNKIYILWTEDIYLMDRRFISYGPKIYIF